MEERENLESFCEILRKRSKDHLSTAERCSDIPSTMFSLLRQELDSLIRVIYLLSLSDLGERAELINLTLNDKPWTTKTEKGKDKKITDRDMVEISDRLIGWTRSVYKFGCSFIHLSSFHNYQDSNPFEKLSDEEKVNVLSHMRNYHGGPSSDKPSFEELAHYLPRVLEKLSKNLECYIGKLEEGTLVQVSEYLIVSDQFKASKKGITCL